ncbi:MAG: dihydrolipoyllysine-residue acetyltransferase [Gammaproteobacteria bacterium]|nr:dihydrolipoyllysine-residue acetyltransferase [Gammaproteobacteria bacterium]
MSNIVEIKVPDIGDSENVEVIVILVDVGDSVALDDSILTLESDKASMEVPAEQAGTIQSLSIKIGDSVSAGDVIGSLALHGSQSSSNSAVLETSVENSKPTNAGSTALNSAADSNMDPKPSAGASSAPSTNAPNTTTKVQVPDIGDAAEVEVIEILVSVGDEVSAEQSLVTLESDKASMEIPSPASGTVIGISTSVGDTVSMGTPLLELATSSTDKPAQSNAPKEAAPVETTTAIAAAAATEPDSSKEPTPSSNPVASPTAHIPDDTYRAAHASPGVRRYAREHGADLSLIKGTGPKERILKEDVIKFIKQSLEGMQSNYGANTNSAVGAGIPAIPAIDFSKFGDIERVDLGRINKLSAANLHRAWLNLPMVTHHDSADITAMEAFRQDLKKEAKEGDAKITGLAFHMKALAKTLQAFPKVNSSLSPDGEALILKKYCHIGIAVDTPNGLVVPVFRDVDLKSITELAEEMADVSSRAREKKLKPDEMQGASMTISSLGGIGGSAFTPIVNPPEVAILGITRATMQPVWNGSDFEPRLMCPLDLTYDHRVVDGADAARFMAHYIKIVGDVRRLIL